MDIKSQILTEVEQIGGNVIAVADAMEKCPSLNQVIDNNGKHPMQPIINNRFEANPIIDWLCTEVSNMNDIAIHCSMNDIPAKYQEQVAQLVGYSISGYGDLSYVSDESYYRAECLINGLPKK